MFITDAYTRFVSQSPEYPRFLVAGESALLVELGDRIDTATNDHVLQLDSVLQRIPKMGVLETIPAYRSLLVMFDPILQTHDSVMEVVEEALAHCVSDVALPQAVREWTIPVVYGGAHGFDLAHVAGHCGRSEAEVVALHAQATYRVFMIGFNPGFPYLGGLTPELYIPRRAVPTPQVEPGCVIIGGGQAAITSVATPTGWYVLGRTPVRAFDLGRQSAPFLFRAGDVIRFHPISQADHDRLLATEHGGAICREGATA
ncbi:MAG: 5-oxoprolinase subunit PxpB [Acetobacteraceae bacterium]|nr:5-oxoprolinase subunit PxpB [Acetobacteraceae bacterium]